MIPASGYYEVDFDQGGPIGSFPVEAWDDNGSPLIIGSRGLVHAGHVHGAYVVTQASTSRPIAAIRAEPGWRVRYWHAHDEAATWNEPIVGWAVAADGQVDPIVVDADEGPRLLSVIDESHDPKVGLRYVIELRVR